MAFENPFKAPETKGEKKFKEGEITERRLAAEREENARKKPHDKRKRPNGGGEVDLTEDLERHALDDRSFEEKEE